MTMRTLLILIMLLAGCSSNSRSTPKSVSETSASRPTLEARIAFIEQYVTFSRTYLDLEYDVMYQNNGDGMVPGPSDWDIRILAAVPAEEVVDWIPSDTARSTQKPPPWLGAMPGKIPTDGVTEWYREGKSVVGIDRTNSVIVYWNSTTPMVD